MITMMMIMATMMVMIIMIIITTIKNLMMIRQEQSLRQCILESFSQLKNPSSSHLLMYWCILTLTQY